MRMSVLFALTSVFKRVERSLCHSILGHDVMAFGLCRLHYCQYNCRQTASVVRYWGMAAAVIVAFMFNGAQPDEENRYSSVHCMYCLCMVCRDSSSEEKSLCRPVFFVPPLPLPLPLLPFRCLFLIFSHNPPRATFSAPDPAGAVQVVEPPLR